jgi:hypothetical protein
MSDSLRKRTVAWLDGRLWNILNAISEKLPRFAGQCRVMAESSEGWVWVCCTRIRWHKGKHAHFGRQFEEVTT